MTTTGQWKRALTTVAAILLPSMAMAAESGAGFYLLGSTVPSLTSEDQTRIVFHKSPLLSVKA
jgi:hypothetical protein